MTLRLLRYGFNRKWSCQLQNIVLLPNKNTKMLVEFDHNQFNNKSIAQQSQLCRFVSSATNSQQLVDNEKHVTKTKEEDIYEALNVNLQKRSRIPLKGLEEFLRISENLSDDQMVFLLKCPCFVFDETLQKRQELLKQIWEKRCESNVSNHVMVAYLKACHRLKMPIDLKNIINEKSSDVVRQLGFQIACRTGDLNMANKILSEAKEKSILNERFFAPLIECYTVLHQYENVTSVLEAMDAKKIQPSSITFVELFKFYIKSQQKEKAESLLKEKIQLFEKNQLQNILLTSLEANLNEECVVFLLKHLPSDIMDNHELDPFFRNICSELILKEKTEAIEVLLKYLPTPSYQSNEDIDIYGTTILEEMVKNVCSTATILKICNILIESGKNTKALEVSLGYALKTASSLSIPLLNALASKHTLRSHYFWPLLIKSSLIDGEIGVIETLKLMTKLNVEVDSETLSLYVLPKLVVTLKNAEKGVKELELVGIKVSTLFTPLFIHLLFQQRYNEVLFLNSLYPTKLDTEAFIYPLITTFTVQKGNQNFIPTFARLLKSLNDKTSNQKHDLVGHVVVELISNPKTKFDHQSIINLLKCLRQQKLKMSKTAIEIIQQNFGKFLDEESKKSLLQDLASKEVTLPEVESYDSHIRHPRDMNLEELECHLQELETKKLNTRGVLRRLLQMCVREGKLDRALEIKKKCDAQKVDASPGMLACIFDIYVRTKKIDDASFALRKLNQKYPGFLVDEHKIIDFAAVLVEFGQIEEAKKILRLRAQVANIRGGDSINKNIWNLLNLLASRAKVNNTLTNETKDFFLFLNKLGYCGYHNSVVGPIIKEHLNKNDVRSAIAEFKSFCQNHRVTPLQRQLLTLLVDISNNEESQKQYGLTQDEARQLLQEVIVSATSVHGPASTNIALIVAFAEAGTDKQLRKMLIDPKVRISPEILRKQCEYLNSNKKLDALLKLARCSRGINHFREQDVYNMILDTLVKENDCEGALNLFENLVADDELKISSEFSNTLIALLKKNNLEPPTNVALYAK